MQDYNSSMRCIHLFLLLQALTRAVQKATGCAGVRVRQNNGPAAGQVVPQLHFHVIPVEGPEDEVCGPVVSNG
jgi:diadenosine tetraphosphate (Ap4A) HIT family hydrolase